MVIDQAEINTRPAYDEVLLTLSDYVTDYVVDSKLALETARYCLMDTLGCGILALSYPACTKLLGPVIPGTMVPNGVPIPGTSFILDPILAAFNIGSMIRWLDYNDTWLAAEWGHPSDNLGAILAVGDYVSRNQISTLTMGHVLEAMVKAYEIQGILALENSFNRVGLDHVILVKAASAAIAMQLLGGSREDINKVLSHVFVDGQSLRTYRHSPNTGSRKSWAAGDATSRAVRLAWLVKQGEQGYPSVLSTKTWGFYDVSLRQQAVSIPRKLGSYVMENILFKIAYPAEFHAQTAVECAIQLHPQVFKRLQNIEKIEIITQESAVRIISKTGPLHNPADRDHCLQYMVAAGLLFGNLKAEYYEDAFAHDERIDFLRSKMHVREESQFTKDYLDPNKRSIANAVQVFFKDGSYTEKVCVDYPIGHKRRREEGLSLLVKKFKDNMLTRYSEAKMAELMDLLLDGDKLMGMKVADFMDLLRGSE